MSSTVTNTKAKVLMLRRRGPDLRRSDGAGRLNFDGLVSSNPSFNTDSNPPSSVGGEPGVRRRGGSVRSTRSNDGDREREEAVGIVDDNRDDVIIGEKTNDGHTRLIGTTLGDFRPLGNIKSARVGALTAHGSRKGDALGGKTTSRESLHTVDMGRGIVGAPPSPAGEKSGSSAQGFGFHTKRGDGAASPDDNIEVGDGDSNDNGTDLYGAFKNSKRWPSLRRNLRGASGISGGSTGTSGGSTGTFGGSTRTEGGSGGGREEPAVKKKPIATRIGEMFAGLPLTKLKIVIGEEIIVIRVSIQWHVYVWYIAL